jgi:hypothetical protein
MAGTEGCEPVRGSQSQKTGRSPDRSLQLDSVKSESLVIANQHVAVNTLAVPEVGSLTFGGTLTTVWSMTGVKS